MDLTKIPLFAMLNTSLSWLARNHAVLSENIANANTPDFKARRLKAIDFGRTLQASIEPIDVAKTKSAHLTGTAPGRRFTAEDLREPLEVEMTGNSVSIEEQSVLIAKNAMEYQIASALYGKSLGLVRTALGTGR